jgi:uncharacterized protein (TIGR00251 family)
VLPEPRARRPGLTGAPRGTKVAHAPDGVRFAVHVSPGARRARVGGEHGDALRVAVTAPPAEGRANRACVAALAEALGVSRSAVRLVAGERGRRKQVAVTGDPERLERRLRELRAGG